MMMMISVFTLCGLVGRCQHFGGMYCLHLQGLSGNAGNRRDYSLPAILYNLCHSQYHHFNLEDGDSMLLQKVSIYRPVHTVPKPKLSSLRISYLKIEYFYQCISLYKISTYFDSSKSPDSLLK